MTISMKKLATIALSGTMLVSGLAVAEGLEFDPKVYLGAEVSGNRYNTSKNVKLNDGTTISRTDNKSLFGKNGAGISGFIGTRLNQYAGLEAGYTALSSLKATYNNNGLVTNSSATANNAYVDAMGYLPIADQIDAIGSLGVGFLSTKVSGNYNVTGTNITRPFSQKSTKAGVRVGAGLAYKFDECLSARFMVRYQQGNKHIKSIASAGLGIAYQF